MTKQSGSWIFDILLGVQEMLGPEIDLEMRQYVRDGAHYVPTVTQVAYEEQQ